MRSIEMRGPQLRQKAPGKSPPWFGELHPPDQYRLSAVGSSHGNGTVLIASANSFLPDNLHGQAFEQVDPSRVYSYKNNIGWEVGSGVIIPVTGF
jgi:hypothetical protein